MAYKILFVHGNSSNIGGQEMALLNTIRGLKDLNIESIVVLPQRLRFAQLLQDNHIKLYYINLSRLSKKTFLPFMKTVHQIFNVAKKEGVSIIHSSGAYPTQYCLLAARWARIPCVAHVHSISYSRRDIKRSLTPHADSIIAVSDSVKNMLIRYGCPSEKTKTIYCGVINAIEDSMIRSEDLRQKYGLDVEDKIVGQVSLISPLKGIEYFIQMAAKIKNVMPKVKFMIIGNAASGYEEYEAKMKRYAEELNLSGNIIFTGFQKDVKNYISLFDINILSSLSEGLPFSVVEALSLGKPVVATSVGGVPEVIIDNKTGVLIPPKDSEAMAHAVLFLLKNPERARTLGEEGRRMVLDMFSINAYARTMKDLYNNILGGTRSKNILFYDTSSGFSGSASAMVHIIKNLDRSRFIPIVAFANHGSQIKKLNNILLIQVAGYTEFPKLSYLRFLFDLFIFHLPQTLKLFFILKSEKISLVHVNTNILLGIPAIIAAKLARVPCICHIRETRSLIKREKLLAGLVDSFVVLNKQAYEIYKKDIPEMKIKIIYDGLNLDEFTPAQGERSAKEFSADSKRIIGVIGRIVDGKGQKEFILAAKEVLKAKSDARFIIVGGAKGGDDKYYKEVEEMILSEKLSENITLTGWKDDIKSVMSGLDILVLPSTTFPEGLPNAIIEAMAFKKPVIATNIPGPSDIVIDGETGFLVPPGEIKALAEKIIYFLDNPEIAKKMGEAGRKRAEEHFNIKDKVKEIEKIYEEVLA